MSPWAETARDELGTTGDSREGEPGGVGLPGEPFQNLAATEGGQTVDLEVEPETSIPEESQIPLVTDTKALRPKAGELQLSQNAINARLRRVMTPTLKGKTKVSQEIVNDWHSSGPSGKKRKQLQQIFQLCGYNVDHWPKFKNMFSFHQNLLGTEPSPQASFFALAASRSQETFVEEVEVLRQELEESEVVIEGEYVSKDVMLSDWGWSE